MKNSQVHPFRIVLPKRIFRAVNAAALKSAICVSVWLICLLAAGCSVQESQGPTTILELDRGRRVAVEATLKTDGELAGEHLTVTVKGAVVTLDGSVQTLAEKERAEKMAAGVQGIRLVINNLKVLPNAKE